MTLSVVGYNSKNQLNELSFIDDSDIPTFIICPSPKSADDLRKLFSKSSNPNVHTLTISKFCTDVIANLDSIKSNRKSEIYLELAALFLKVFAGLTNSTFQQAFLHLTELRGATNDYSIVEEILEDFDDELAQVIRYFWAYMDQRPLFDEHSVYRQIVTAIRESNAKLVEFFEEEKNIIFWGFSFLSNEQVDLVKALAIRFSVYVPFYNDLLEKTKNSDWVSWLSGDTIELEKLLEKEKIVNIVEYEKGNLQEYMNAYQFKNDLVFDNVILSQKNPSLSEIQAIGRNDLYFKTQCNLIEDKLKTIKDDLSSSLSDSPDLRLPIDEVFQNLNIKKEYAIKAQDFRQLKAIELFSNCIKDWVELSDDHDYLNQFILDVVSEVSLLNSPRNFYLSQYDKEAKGIICGLENLTGLGQGNNAFVVSSSFLGLKGGVKSHSEETAKILATIGPVRNTELEFQILKKEIIEFLEQEGTVLFIEKDLLENNLSWAQVIGNIKVNNIDLEIKPTLLKNPKDYLKSKMIISPEPPQKISASRMQTFIDCKRKYYFSYVNKWEFLSGKMDSVDARVIGKVEHDLVDKATTMDIAPESNELRELAGKLLKQELSREEVAVEDSKFLEALNEIITYSSNGIRFLQDLKLKDSSVEFIFESRLKSDEVSGSIDCIIKSKIFGNGIIDFKRSGGGIPKKIEMEKMQKVQVWFYVNFCNLEELDFFGYVNLSDLKKSLIVCEDSSLKQNLQEIHGLDSKSIINFKDTVASLKENFISFFNETKNELIYEKNFLPIPRSNDVCSYCDLSIICNKKGEE